MFFFAFIFIELSKSYARGRDANVLTWVDLEFLLLIFNYFFTVSCLNIFLLRILLCCFFRFIFCAVNL